MTTVTVILPTIGRPTLQAAIDSCAGADQLLVVPDASGDRGHTARNRTMPEATSDLIAYMDDDDIFLPGAIEAIRAHASLTCPSVFRVDCPWNGVVWRDPVLRFANVSTQGIVVPNKPPFGVWGPDGGGDYEFLRQSAELAGEMRWVAEVIAVLRPHERPGIMERYAA